MLPDREPDQVYPYEDPETGEVLFEVCRWDEPDGKKICQRTRESNGAIKWNLEGVKRHPLYRERALNGASDRPLLVVEGEKCVEAVLSLGLDVLVTTNPMGAGKWRPEHTGALEGRSRGARGALGRSGRRSRLRQDRSRSRHDGRQFAQRSGHPCSTPRPLA